MPKPGEFFVVPQEAIDTALPKMGGASAKVLLYLCRHADRETGECFRSQETIGSGCGFGLRTTRNCLVELADLGVIQIRNRGQRSNLYTVCYPARSCRLEDDLTGNILPDNTNQTGKELPDTTGRILPVNDLTGKILPFNRQDSAAYQDSLSKKKEESAHSTESKKRSKSETSGYSQAFKDWYLAYPRKVAKGAAAKAFTQAVGRLVADPDRNFSSEVDAVEFLKQRAQAYATEVADTATEYQAHPATWLNQDRFDDEYEADKPKPNAVATKADLDAEGIQTIGFDDDE